MSLFNVNSNEPNPSNTTTIIGVIYDDGIILGSTDTITQLTSNVVSCHCTHKTEILLEDVRNFIVEQENIKVTVETIGTILTAFKPGMKNILQTSVIIGGGKKIYEVSDVGIVGEKSNFCVGGYGVAHLNKLLEREWKKGMNEVEAEKLILRTLSLNISPHIVRSCGIQTVNVNIVRSCGIQTVSVNSKGVTRAFHPHNTLPIRGRALLERVPARSISLHQHK